MLYYLPEEKGQGLVEYGLMLVLIAVVVISIVILLGEEVERLYQHIVGSMPSSLQ